MGYGDIVIHIDEALDDPGIHALERALGAHRGVVSACVAETRRHLLVVDFDPDDVRPSELVRASGLHAAMMGL